MSEQWDGRPQNPERNGWHWVRPNVSPAYAPECWFWIASAEVFERDASDQDDPWFPTHYDYLGPCLTPAEVAAQVEAARRDEREENAELVERIISPWSIAASEELAAEIRARGDA